MWRMASSVVADVVAIRTVAVDIEESGHHPPVPRRDDFISGGNSLARRMDGNNPAVFDQYGRPLDFNIRGHNMGINYQRFHNTGNKSYAPSICHTFAHDKSLDL
jgi:hypothetical protein